MRLRTVALNHFLFVYIDSVYVYILYSDKGHLRLFVTPEGAGNMLRSMLTLKRVTDKCERYQKKYQRN